MNSRALLVGLVFPVFTSSVWGQAALPPPGCGACGLSSTALTSGAPSPAAPIAASASTATAAPAPIPTPAPAPSSAATATSIGTTSPAVVPGSGLRNVTPDEIKHDPFRARTGFGAPSKLDMRIEGDGVALPAGVGAKNQNQAKTNPDRESKGEKSKAPAAEKGRREDTAQDKVKGLAKAGGPEPQNQPADGSDPSNSAADGKEGRPAIEKSRRGNRPVQEGNGENMAVTPSQLTPTRDANPVVQRMDRGFERDPGVARPTNIKLKESGVALPACTSESREGVACGQQQ